MTAQRPAGSEFSKTVACPACGWESRDSIGGCPGCGRVSWGSLLVAFILGPVLGLVSFSIKTWLKYPGLAVGAFFTLAWLIGIGQAIKARRRPPLKRLAPSVRLAALKNVDDLGIIKEAASSDSDASVRAAAVGKIDDQDFLAGVVRQDQDSKVRAAAAARLTHPPVLMMIVKEHVDPAVRIAVVRNLTDQDLLAQLASQDPLPDVRREAAQRLIPEHPLRRAVLAVDASELETVRGPDELLAFARFSAEKSVRAAAVSRLTDPAALAQVVSHGGDMAGMALRQLNDPEQILEIAKSSPRPAAIDAETWDARLLPPIQSLDDPEALAEIAITQGRDARESFEISKAAVARVSDPALLIRIARNSVLKEEVLERIEDALLEEIASHDPDAGMRRAAALNLRNVAPLLQIAREDADEGVRWTAVRKLTNPDALLEIAGTDRSARVRRAAAWQLGCMICHARLHPAPSIPAGRAAIMMGEALIGLMGEASTAAYRCRGCGLYICRDHATSHACLGCGNRVYDSVSREPTWYSS